MLGCPIEENRWLLRHLLFFYKKTEILDLEQNKITQPI